MVNRPMASKTQIPKITHPVLVSISNSAIELWFRVNMKVSGAISAANAAITASTMKGVPIAPARDTLFFKLAVLFSYVLRALEKLFTLL